MPSDKLYILVRILPKDSELLRFKELFRECPIQQNWEMLIPEDAGGDIPYHRLCDVRLQQWAQIVRDLSQTNAA